MKIGFNFHSSDDFISGVEYYSLGLLRGFLDIDKENHYVVFTNRPALVNSLVGTQKNLKVKDCSFLKNRPLRILWEHLRLPIIAKKEGLDILHCPHYICPAIKSSVKYIVTIHDTIAIDNPKCCKMTNAVYYRLFLKKSVKKSSKISTVSEFTAERVGKNFDANNSKIKVIYPGVDTDIFNLYQDGKKQDQVRTKYKLPKDYILYAGNIEPKKNILNLLKAFSLLKNKGIVHSLVISGRRSWRSKNVLDFLRNEFKPDQVRLTGYIDRADIGFVYKMAGCLVLPSFCEGFGFPAIEAFACGIPVASSRVGILQETDPKAFTHLISDSPEQMAKSIKRLLTDYKLREMQIKTGLIQAAKFDWEICAAKTLALYENAINENR